MANGEKEVSCPNCTGACCRDLKIQLTRPEVTYLRERGTTLHPIIDADPNTDWGTLAKGEDDSDDPRVQRGLEWTRKLKPGEGIYYMEGPCGNLVEKDGWLQCAAYGDPQRPIICSNFQPGSDACVKLFDSRAGTPVELGTKPRLATPDNDNLAARILSMRQKRLNKRKP